MRQTIRCKPLIQLTALGIIATGLSSCTSIPIGGENAPYELDTLRMLDADEEILLEVHPLSYAYDHKSLLFADRRIIRGDEEWPYIAIQKVNRTYGGIRFIHDRNYVWLVDGNELWFVTSVKNAGRIEKLINERLAHYRRVTGRTEGALPGAGGGAEGLDSPTLADRRSRRDAFLARLGTLGILIQSEADAIDVDLECLSEDGGAAGGTGTPLDTVLLVAFIIHASSESIRCRNDPDVDTPAVVLSLKKALEEVRAEKWFRRQFSEFVEPRLAGRWHYLNEMPATGSAGSQVDSVLALSPLVGIVRYHGKQEDKFALSAVLKARLLDAKSNRPIKQQDLSYVGKRICATCDLRKSLEDAYLYFAIRLARDFLRPTEP